MIQRIQSVFLILAAAAFGLLFKVPFATSDTTATSFLQDRVYNIFDHPVLLVMTILGIGLSLVSIFLFRNRKKQRRLVYVMIIFAILLPVAAFLLFMGDAPTHYASADVHDQAGLFVPAAAILFGFLANYFIRKDDKLVKSMDRLR